MIIFSAMNITQKEINFNLFGRQALEKFCKSFAGKELRSKVINIFENLIDTSPSEITKKDHL